MGTADADPSHSVPLVTYCYFDVVSFALHVCDKREIETEGGGIGQVSPLFFLCCFSLD